ncbi:response regulator [Sinomicrobium soli]|uniref:hypothetical protein n=1 Tax=Sinomicrobium sp. N-1-3-6 TaxID=2219864 RepID=UPI001374AF42|nr:hypothetical protein [Sinomicrobium sp. N-1-3-6]
MVKNFLKDLRQVRKQHQLRNTLIVIYSSGASEQLIEDTFVYGANVYMDKPHTYEKFREVVEKILKINFQYLESNLNIENFIYRT